MNACALSFSTDIQACIGQVVNGWLGPYHWLLVWAPWIGWGILLIGVIWFLSQVKNVLGEPGMVVVAATLAYAFGYLRAHQKQSFDPFPHHDLPAIDAQPAPKQNVPVVKPKSR